MPKMSRPAWGRRMRGMGDTMGLQAMLAKGRRRAGDVHGCAGRKMRPCHEPFNR